jgi:negative regulator of flagellin synthesis FlgM
MNVKEAIGIGPKALEGRDRSEQIERSGSKAKSASGAAAQAVANDTVELSGRSKEMAKAAELLANTSDVRQAKVAEVKARIANNEYHVDAEKVAHKMIVDFLGELV